MTVLLLLQVVLLENCLPVKMTENTHGADGWQWATTVAFLVVVFGKLGGSTQTIRYGT